MDGNVGLGAAGNVPHAMSADTSGEGMRRARRRGAFVVLVGPDGVGKTTIARALVAQRAGPTAYFHFLPALWGELAPGPPTDPGAPPPKSQRGGSRVLGWLRLLRSVARCWATYVARIAPARRRGTLVVGDRWLYGYLVQPRALKYYGPPGLAGAVLRFLPRPDLVVNLSAPVPLIRARKQELTPQDIEAELHGWAKLPADRLRTFDAAATPDVIAAQVLEALDRLAARTPVPLGTVGIEQV